jgi:uroporphyrin-III C-methyltransferase
VLDDESLDWRSLAGSRQTVVFYMGVGHLPQIVGKLRAAGAPADLPAAVVERATLPEQRTLRGTLETISDVAQAANVTPPALLIVGAVTALAGADSVIGSELEALA